MSSGASEHQPPEPPGVQSEVANNALKHGGKHHPLQPFSPEEASRESVVTGASHSLLCLTPIRLAPTERFERVDCKFGGFEGHGHSVARHGWDHGQCIADTTFFLVASE